MIDVVNIASQAISEEVQRRVAATLFARQLATLSERARSLGFDFVKGSPCISPPAILLEALGDALTRSQLTDSGMGATTGRTRCLDILAALGALDIRLRATLDADKLVSVEISRRAVPRSRRHRFAPSAAPTASAAPSPALVNSAPNAATVSPDPLAHSRQPLNKGSRRRVQSIPRMNLAPIGLDLPVETASTASQVKA